MPFLNFNLTSLNPFQLKTQLIINKQQEHDATNLSKNFNAGIQMAF